MFPAFWRFFSGRTVLGEFFAQNSNSEYVYMNPPSVWAYSSTPSNTDSYKWRLIYSVEDDKVLMQSKIFTNWIYEDNYQLYFTKLNYNKCGDVYIQNVGSSDYLTYNSYTNTFSYDSFSASDNQKWTINYFSNSTFTISPKTDQTKYFDLVNGNDFSGNSIQLYYGTGNQSAQTWQIRNEVLY